MGRQAKAVSKISITAYMDVSPAADPAKHERTALFLCSLASTVIVDTELSYRCECTSLRTAERVYVVYIEASSGLSPYLRQRLCDFFRGMHSGIAHYLMVRDTVACDKQTTISGG